MDLAVEEEEEKRDAKEEEEDAEDPALAPRVADLRNATELIAKIDLWHSFQQEHAQLLNLEQKLELAHDRMIDAMDW